MAILEIAGKIATTFGVLVACIGLFLNYRGLLLSNRWHRSNNAISLMEKWNSETSTRRQAIEKKFPGLADVDQENKTVKLSKDEADQIYAAKPGDASWELRSQIIELCNYFEIVSASYLNEVADREMIELSVRNTMMRYHDFLQSFIDVVVIRRKYQPWIPYQTLISHWKSQPTKTN